MQIPAGDRLSAAQVDSSPYLVRPTRCSGPRRPWRSAGLDEAAGGATGGNASAIDEIARECGYLPLTLQLAGRIVASYGQTHGWETEIFELLAASHSAELRQRTFSASHSSEGNDDGKSFTLEDRIISVSLHSIKGPSSESIKKLFKALALVSAFAWLP